MTTRKKDVTKTERYRILKTMLEDRRQEIHDKLRSLREELPEEIATVKDTEEQSVQDFVREVDFTLMHMKSQTLRKIDEALRRVESGEYGVCDQCGTEIAEARLKALPFAHRCRTCQEQEEARQAEARASETRHAREELESLR